ncbi:hypothetical protein J4Q44_G00061090 [Coregonus suidteri]|uniref:PiggyBac transposable element-derived protein domain-containing protein n=1 Tax=Coregonus suidteri TaxID=861788 RepID=A0AAN8MH60_9TELE
MESDTEMEDFDRSEEGSNWSDDSYLADEDFSFDYQEGVDPHEDALDWEEEDSNESASDSPPRVTPRIESQSESGVNGSESPEETWLPCKGSQSTRTSSVETEEDEGPLLSTLHPDQQRSPSTKTHSPRKRVLASPSLKSKVPRYHVYLDNYFSSPKLFKDLFDMKMGACGTMREGRQGFPRAEENALTKKSPRGSLRWIREGSLLFVKWKDAREVSMGTTIHQAYGGEKINRKHKNKDGKWSHESIPVPTPILEYNKNMGGVDLSDQLITYFSAHRKTMKWYRTLFYHFVDIATTNSYIIHKDLCKVNKMQPMTHKEFTQALVAQLCEVSIETQSKPKNTGHTPVPIKPVADKSKRSSAGRKRCELCKKSGHSKDTPWKCNECGVPLCVIPDRNCFHDWHNLEGMAPVEYQSSDS